MNTLAKWTAAAALLLLAGCATNTPTPYVREMNPHTAKTMGHTKIYFQIPQKGLQAEYLGDTPDNLHAQLAAFRAMHPRAAIHLLPIQSNAGAGSSAVAVGVAVGGTLLAAALIYGIHEHEVGKAKEVAHTKLANIQKGLDDAPLNLELENALGQVIKAQSWANNAIIVPASVDLPTAPPMKASRVVVHASYAFSPNFDCLVVRARVSIYKPGTGSKKALLVYRNSFTYQSKNLPLAPRPKALRNREYAKEMARWKASGIPKLIEKIDRDNYTNSFDQRIDRRRAIAALQVHRRALALARSSYWVPKLALKMYTAQWRANHGALIQSAMANASQSLAEMLKLDLDGKVAQIKAEKQAARHSAKHASAYTVIEKTPQHTFLLTKTGMIGFASGDHWNRGIDYLPATM